MVSGVFWTCVLVLHGVLYVGSDVRPVSVKEGDSVTLHNDFKITNEYKIRWYFKNTRIAEIDLSDGKSCTDVQCDEGAERFRDRLKLDHQTGSLTIMNIRITDSGEYTLEDIHIGDVKEESFNVTVLSVLYAGSDGVSVSVKEGESVTLHNDFKITNEYSIIWYLKKTQIAEIDLSNGKSCTDVQCNEGTERFRDRLKLDHQTGSLTINNTRSTDSGEYRLKVISTGDDKEESFNVTVLSVFSAGSVSVSVKEGESVTLHNDFKIANDYRIRWYFNNTRTAAIDLSDGKTCTDVQCNEGTEGFRGRLKLDHQTGSLTIMNTRSTDSGEYKLEVISIHDDGEKTFSVTVLRVSAVDKHEMEKDPEGESDTSDSGLSAAAVGGICVTALVVLLVIGAGVLMYGRNQGNGAQNNHEPVPLGVMQENAVPLVAVAANENL